MITNSIEEGINDFSELEFEPNTEEEKKEQVKSILLQQEQEKINLGEFKKFLSSITKDKQVWNEIKFEIENVLPRIKNRYGLTREEWNEVEFRLQNKYLKWKAKGKKVKAKKFLLKDLANVDRAIYDYNPVLSIDYRKRK